MPFRRGWAKYLKQHLSPNSNALEVAIESLKGQPSSQAFSLASLSTQNLKQSLVFHVKTERGSRAG